MRRIFLFALFGFIILASIKAQTEDLHSLFFRFSDLYKAGDFIGAEQCMLTIIDDSNNSPKPYLYSAYNNIGLVKKSVGLYDAALQYFTRAEEYSGTDNYSLTILASVYANKSRIFTFKRSYETAISFLEKAIRIFAILEDRGDPRPDSYSTAYLNLGVVNYESGDYNKALDNLTESLNLKLKYNLPEKELTYLNLAKTFIAIGDRNNAEKYYRKSLDEMVSQFGSDYYRMPEIYFGYADFLSSIGKTEEALQLHLDALRICLKNYGEKHVMVALAYKQIAEFYVSQYKYLEALQQFQKALIAISSGFEDTDPYSNPSPVSSLFSVRLLEILKSKSDALVEYSIQKNDSSGCILMLNASLSTIELAIDLIDRIRNDYLTEENRIYLAENEKETYISAIRIAANLYDLTGDRTLIPRMYTAAAKAKAAVLRNEMADNDLMWSAGEPDSLLKRYITISNNISAYNNLILNESQNTSPDSMKISLWKDALFDMSREHDRMNSGIREKYPLITDLSEKTEPLNPAELMKLLGKKDAIADYILSNVSRNGLRELFVFIITRDSISFYRSTLDSLFGHNASVIRTHCEGRMNRGFGTFTGALSYMYETLVRPYEKDFPGKNLLIIPDEEISRLPFDAFLTSPADHGAESFEEQPWLIKRYSVSYSYSSSLLISNDNQSTGNRRLISFRPGYYGDTGLEINPSVLSGAERETEFIHRIFKGTRSSGADASETNFRRAVSEPAILHLAMHSVTDTADSRYSWLAFDSRSDTSEDGRLYNYEISHMRMRSPMVVLSACNSGTGNLYHGEGLMSLARSFILAGASSVVRTSWEVNDETSAAVIMGFYRNLRKGMGKNEALRKAKLDFISGSIPEFSDPYYWAGYELIGDVSPVKGRKGVILIPAVAAFLVVLIMSSYLRRRRIRAERSE